MPSHISQVGAAMVAVEALEPQVLAEPEQVVHQGGL